MVDLIKVNNQNKEAMLQLKVKEDQIGYIETVKQCLDEAKIDERWFPLGIYHQQDLIGFAMIGEFLYPDGMRTWMDRFLIDQNSQGQGYGKRALVAVLYKCIELYQHDEIYLSIYEDNAVAFKLYSKIGFELNGELDDHGEKVMILRSAREKLERYTEVYL